MTTGVTEPFAYHAPTTVREASQTLSRYRGDAKLLAGGHSLIPMMKLRLASPEAIVDLKDVEGITGVTENDDGSITIGSMTTYYELINSDVINSKVPVIAEVASEIADTQVRNWGTIGGSLAHADPAGDLPAVAIALGCTIHTESARAKRMLLSERFFRGYLDTALRASEVLTAVEVPAQDDGSACAYVKLANKASHYAIVGVAASVTIDESGVCTAARIGITGAGPHAIRGRRVERILIGKELTQNIIDRASLRAGIEIRGEFNDDVHASAEYREAMTKVYTARAIARAVARATN